MAIKYLTLLILLTSCSANDEKRSSQTKQKHLTGDYIKRKSDEYKYIIPPPKWEKGPEYPWENTSQQ